MKTLKIPAFSFFTKKNGMIWFDTAGQCAFCSALIKKLLLIVFIVTQRHARYILFLQGYGWKPDKVKPQRLLQGRNAEGGPG